MEPSFILVGKLTRDYLFPPIGQPLLDSPGGSLLYAAGGLGVWETRLGLVGRVGENYPRQWLKDWSDAAGISRASASIPARSTSVFSWPGLKTLSPAAPIPFRNLPRRGVPFPKALLGFQPRSDSQTASAKPDPVSPLLSDIPSYYLDAGTLASLPAGVDRAPAICGQPARGGAKS